MGVPLTVPGRYPVPASKAREATDNVWQKTGYARFHGGNDIPPSKPGVEGENVYPMWGGVVVFAESKSSHKPGTWGSDYGNRVLVKHKTRHTHSNGTTHTHDWYSFYAHLRVLSTKAGAAADPAKRLGTLGDTGNSTAPHVHFAIQLDPGWLVGVVDPHPYLEKFRKLA